MPELASQERQTRSLWSFFLHTNYLKVVFNWFAETFPEQRKLTQHSVWNAEDKYFNTGLCCHGCQTCPFVVVWNQLGQICTCVSVTIIGRKLFSNRLSFGFLFLSSSRILTIDQFFMKLCLCRYVDDHQNSQLTLFCKRTITFLQTQIYQYVCTSWLVSASFCARRWVISVTNKQLIVQNICFSASSGVNLPFSLHVLRSVVRPNMYAFLSVYSQTTVIKCLPQKMQANLDLEGSVCSPEETWKDFTEHTYKPWLGK